MITVIFYFKEFEIPTFLKKITVFRLLLSFPDRSTKFDLIQKILKLSPNYVVQIDISTSYFPFSVKKFK